MRKGNKHYNNSEKRHECRFPALLTSSSIWESIILHSLSSRFLLAFIAIIAITTLSAGVPAYIIIRTELDRQSWTHVADGGRVTLALLETEKIRLENLAVLVSQRPTLQNLVQRRDMDALNEYLQTFQKTVDLDVLVLSDKSGQVLAKGAEFNSSVGSPFSQEAAFQALPGARTQLALSVSRPVPVDMDQDLFVTVGIILSDDYATKLASATGFEHSFLINEQRVSTTLNNAPSAVAVEAVRRATALWNDGNCPFGFRKFPLSHCLDPLARR
jgi:hypothetical protein